MNRFFANKDTSDISLSVDDPLLQLDDSNCWEAKQSMLGIKGLNLWELQWRNLNLCLSSRLSAGHIWAIYGCNQRWAKRLENMLEGNDTVADNFN